ncbi:hypothetical protein MOQ72_30835 [Saccharopolyspora sp. K220]|uniref:hypothetical protein n=1 Tax=Saccharopolyspora soli TaxID=2926618 RepID=UPI001F581E08|nr:hypothetical protein [Saccharopolyspora soli]MCI2421840.1 hypothetical protein [Saccharopolyspora soli]
MDASTPCRPCTGLDNSGCVLAIMRENTLITSYVNDSDMISISVPGKPCDVLLVLDAGGAEELIAQLNLRLSELHRRRNSGGEAAILRRW